MSNEKDTLSSNSKSEADIIMFPIILATIIFVVLVLVFSTSSVASYFKEKEAVSHGNYVEDLLIVEEINFEKKEYGGFTMVNIETENDYRVLFVNYHGNKSSKKKVNFERSSKKHNELRISKYEHEGETWKEEYTLYINEDSIKELKKEYYEVAGEELDL